MCEYPSNLCLNLIPKPAGEPVFLVFSKHITSWYNNDRDEGKEYTQVEVAYPRWKFLPQSSINYIIQGEKIVALDEEEKDIKILALQDEPDPDDPEPPVKKKSPVPAQPPQLALPPGPSKPTVTPKRNTATAPRANVTWRWGPTEEATLPLEEKKTHPGAWALFADDWQNRMFGPLRTCFFRPENTWKNAIKSPGNAGTKGDITAFHGYLHMNAYPVFLVPRLQTHSAEQQEKMDRGKISPTYIKGLFGKNIIPNVCYSTAKLVDGIQWTEGQHVCISGHNQVAFYPVDYTEEETVMPFAQHENGIRWKILAILWSSEPTKLTKIAGDTLVS